MFNLLIINWTVKYLIIRRNGTFNRSVECLENLYTECGKKMIVPFAEPSEWRHAVVTLCGNLQGNTFHHEWIQDLYLGLDVKYKHLNFIFYGYIGEPLAHRDVKQQFDLYNMTSQYNMNTWIFLLCLQ